MKSLIAPLLSLAVCATASAGTYLTATIDGNFAEWASVPVTYSDPVDNPGSADFTDIKIANDDDFLYLTVSYPGSLSAPTFISIDFDSNSATGYDVFGLGLAGVEASWQNDFPFTSSTGVFNNGSGMSGDFFGSGAALMSPGAGVNSAQHEWKISLANTFNAGGGPVFDDDTFRVLIWTDSGAGDVSAAIDYTLATIPEPTGTSLLLLTAGMMMVRRRR